MGARTLKRLAILVTTIVVVSLATFFLWKHQVAAMDQSVLAQAEKAENEGKLDEALRRYEEHLFIKPDDQEVKLKYAACLLKGPKRLDHQQRAAQIYAEHVHRFAADHQTRRKLVELLAEMERLAEARPHVEILLKPNSKGEIPKDGVLHYLLGRCQEASDQPDKAVESYREAVKDDSPDFQQSAQQLEAYAKRATLLRTQLENRKDRADKVDADKATAMIDEANAAIDEMVKAAPEKALVHRERGSYRRRFGKTPEEREAARADLQVALTKKPDDPKVYIELAELDRSSKKVKEAHEVIEQGLKRLPNDTSLHLERASLELPGSLDKAIASLQKSVDLLPDQPMLHLRLADYLALRGDTDQLLKQIGELKRLNFPPNYVAILNAKYLINRKDSQDWKSAVSSLTRLQAGSPEQESLIKSLLAQCWNNLGDRVREREALEGAILSDPKNVAARRQLVTSLADQGDFENALKAYHQLVDQLPEGRRGAELNGTLFKLVRMLIARNQRRPAPQRDWTEAERVIKDLDPRSSESAVLQTELLGAQGKYTEAQKLIDEARARTPDALDLWLTSANNLRLQYRFDDCSKLLDEASNKFGDSVTLRLERSRLLFNQGAAGVPKAIIELAGDSPSFSRADRRRLLQGLAQAALISKDPASALLHELWSQLANLDRDALEPQLQLFDLAFRGDNKAEIENRLKEIKRIEGSGGPLGKYRDALYVLWQSTHTADVKEQADLRHTARLILDDLKAQRPDWAVPRKTLAELTLADLSRPDASKEEKALKFNESASQYLEAIKLGITDLDTLRRATDLLYAAGRQSEVIPLWSSSTNSAADSVKLREGSAEAFRHNDVEGALELARKAKTAKPDDLEIRVWLAKLLNHKQLPDDAEKELRELLGANPQDLNRWRELIGFLATTKQMEKAEKAVSEAESTLKGMPLGPAKCSELLGLAYRSVVKDEKKAQFWLDKAGRWYRAARDAQPKDRGVLGQYLSFLYTTGQIDAALDQIEQFWKVSNNPEQLVVPTLEVLATSNPERDKSRFERVAGWFQKELEKRPKSLLLTIELGTFLEKLGRFGDSEALYRHWKDKGPENPIVLNNLAWLMILRKENPTEALGYIDRAIKLAGRDPDLLDTRGVILTRLGRFEDANKDLSEAIKKGEAVKQKQVNSAAKYFHRAQAYFEAHQKIEAKKSLERARAEGLPQGLHALELTAYQELLKDMATP